MEYNELDDVEEIKETEEIQETQDVSFSQLLEDPELFDRYTEGQYNYETNDFGKHANGSLMLEKGERDLSAQKNLEGKEAHDDAGHLLGCRFHGDGGAENLDAQDRDLNRGQYKSLENDWAKALKEGEKVYVDVQTYHAKGSQRPDTWMGYSIRESSDGERDWEAFSFCNTSTKEQENWEALTNEVDFRPEW